MLAERSPTTSIFMYTALHIVIFDHQSKGQLSDFQELSGVATPPEVYRLVQVDERDLPVQFGEDYPEEGVMMYYV